jgi:hypothetical protein
MSQTAIDLETKSVYSLDQLCEMHEEETLMQQFSGKRFGCVQCLMEADYERTGVARSLEVILAELQPEQIPAEKSFRRSTKYCRGDDQVFSPSCFTHLPGKAKNAKCASTESRHHQYCAELAAGKRGCVMRSDPPNLIRTTMPRYKKDPGFREPDIAFLTAATPSIAKDIQSQIDRGEHRTLDFIGYKGHIAVEVQLSPLSLHEYKDRTSDHLKRFNHVLWVFHEHFLMNVTTIRAHQSELGEDTWVIVEDGGGQFHLDRRPYKKRGPRPQKKKRMDYCPKAIFRRLRRLTSSDEQAKAYARYFEQQIKNHGFNPDSLFNHLSL